MGPQKEVRGWGSDAHVELSLHWRLVDPIKGTVSLALATGEVEEFLDDCHTDLRIACPQNCEVLSEVHGDHGVDAGRLIQGSQGHCGLVATVVARVMDQGLGASLLGEEQV